MLQHITFQTTSIIFVQNNGHFENERSLCSSLVPVIFYKNFVFAEFVRNFWKNDFLKRYLFNWGWIYMAKHIRTYLNVLFCFIIHPIRLVLKPVTENKTSSGFWEIIKSQFRSELNFFCVFRRASLFDIKSGVWYVSSDLYTICYGGNDWWSTKSLLKQEKIHGNKKEL